MNKRRSNIPHIIAITAGLALVISAAVFMAVNWVTICQVMRTVFIIFLISFGISATVLGRHFIFFGSVLTCTMFLTVLLSVLWFSLINGAPLADTLYIMADAVMPVVIIIGGIWLLLRSVLR